MYIRDEIAANKHKSKVDSSSTQVDDADDGGFVKKRRISKEVVKEKPHVKPKAAVKQKLIVKPKGVPVKSNVGKRKRLDEDVASYEVEDEDVVSNEDGDDVDECVSEEGIDAAEGNDVDDEEDKESEKDKGSEVVDETNEAEDVVKKSTKAKKKGVVSKSKKQKHVSDSSSEEEKVSKPKKFCNKKKQVSESSSSSEDEKPLKNKKKLPCSLFAAIRDSQVDMKPFLSDVGFSSLHNVFIDTLPARLARFVVREFSGSSYQFKLDKGIIHVTPEKVYDILGVPLGGTSIFDLPEIPLDDPFVKLSFKQFHPKPLKDIHAYDIAKKLVLTKRVDFMFKVNFLMLFANVVGTANTMKAIVNLTVFRRIREDTNVAAIDWCGCIHKCLQDSAEPKTVNGFYIGSLCFLILVYLDSTKFDRFSSTTCYPKLDNNCHESTTGIRNPGRSHW
ncbi:hypothetical protein Tco_1449021 [Tanacetum coccineum]